MADIKYKILLIEDDKLDQMAFKRTMEKEGLPYDCTIAGSILEATGILSANRFDVIITDYSLGDGTAFDILDSIKNTPIIFVTGAGDEGVAVKAMKVGACDYLIKDHERNYLKTIPVTIENAIKHKRMEGKLRLLSHAILSTEESVYITDLEDKITFVNRAFCETYGYDEVEVIGKNCSMLWNQTSLTANERGDYSAVNGWEVGFFHRRKDGSGFPVSLTRSEVKDESGNEVAIIVITRDISERMEIENDFRNTNRELEKQNHLQTKLAAAAYDELKMPLVVLKNIIGDAATGAMGKLSPKLQEALDSADKNIDRITKIIHNFYEIAVVDRSGKEELKIS